jgi:hypothetical protein
MSKRANLYEKDFYAWTFKNAELLKQRKFDELDIENIVEEIESMGRSEKRQLMTRLTILIQHLLKWHFQPEKRTNSWKLTIKEQRSEILDLLEESPSLKNKLNFKKAYERAIIHASKETGILEYDFPDIPFFSLNNCLDVNYFPENVLSKS